MLQGAKGCEADAVWPDQYLVSPLSKAYHVPLSMFFHGSRLLMGYGDPSCHASNIKGSHRIRLLNIWKTAVIPTRFSAIDIIGELSQTLLSLWIWSGIGTTFYVSCLSNGFSIEASLSRSKSLLHHSIFTLKCPIKFVLVPGVWIDRNTSVLCFKYRVIPSPQLSRAFVESAPYLTLISKPASGLATWKRKEDRSWLHYV